MSRMAIAVAGLWVALAQQPAAAHARNASASEAHVPTVPTVPTLPTLQIMCGDASQPFVLVSNAGLERGQPHASRNLQPRAAHALPSENDDAPAWCLTPNDPRCSARDTGAPLPGQLLLLPLCDFEVVKLPQLRSIDVASTPPSPELGAALLGVRMRVERPPRG